MLIHRKSLIILALALAAWFPALSQKYDSLPNQPEYYIKRVAAFRSEGSKQGATIFLGNSITEGGKWDVLLKDTSVVNRGISGDNSFGILQRLDEITRHKPSKVFLLIGVNDLSKNIPNATIIQNIFSIVGRIHSESPATQILVQSLLPVNPKHKQFPARYAQQGNIGEINNQLSKYGKPLRYTFVDLYHHFLGDDLLLDLKYTGDGLHLNQAGYDHWVDYLKKNKLL